MTFGEDNGIWLRFAGNFFRGLDVGFAGGCIEEDETDVFYVGAGRHSIDCGAKGDRSGFVNRIAESSSRNRREGERGYAMIVGNADGLTVTTGECCGLVLASAVDGADGVHYVFGGQSSGGGDDGFAGREGTDFGYDAPALLQDGRAAGTMDGTVDASAAEEGGVGGIDDGLRRFFCDVGGAAEFESFAVSECQFCGVVGHSVQQLTKCDGGSGGREPRHDSRRERRRYQFFTISYRSALLLRAVFCLREIRARRRRRLKYGLFCRPCPLL